MNGAAQISLAQQPAPRLHSAVTANAIDDFQFPDELSYRPPSQIIPDVSLRRAGLGLSAIRYPFAALKALHTLGCTAHDDLTALVAADIGDRSERWHATRRVA